MALDPLTAGLDFAKTLVDKIWPDKSEQEKQELAASLALIRGQMDINKAEASNPNWFVAGWRPFVGWVCGFGLAYQFLFYPIVHAFIPALIPLALGDLIPLLFGLLGLGGLRTMEKFNGVAR